MTMHLRHLNAARPVDLGLAARAAPAVSASSPKRPAGKRASVKAPGIVIVVPDVLDGVVGVCDAAGLKGVSKLVCAIGMLALVAL